MDKAPCKMIHVLSYRQWLRTTLISLVKYSSILTLPITCHVMFCFSSIKRLLSGGDASSPCPRPLREGILKISSNISHSCGWQNTVLWHSKLGTQRPTSYSERTLCHTNHGIQNDTCNTAQSSGCGPAVLAAFEIVPTSLCKPVSLASILQQHEHQK